MVENDSHHRSRQRSAGKGRAVILCLCKAVSDREVDDAIRRGASSASAVGQVCGAGTDCGSCLGSIEERLCSGRGRCAASHGHSPQERPAHSAAHS
jgi:bacterioferritin-associated ferredoxin